MAVLLVVLKLLPAIIAGVQAIEAAIPIPAAGKAKLDLIVGLISDVYGSDQSIQKQMPSEQLIPVVTSVVGRLVSVFNTLGLFHPKPV